MSSKFLRREAAIECPVHTLIRAKAAEFLELRGAFSREEVLEATRLQAMAESIRWDYVREFIEKEQGCELIPVSALFFKSPHSKDRKDSPIKIKPEKYLALGNGKRTAGYAVRLPLRRLEQRRGLTNGVGRAFTKFVDEVRAKGSAPVREALTHSQASASDLA
jgi:hypothetical protein